MQIRHIEWDWKIGTYSSDWIERKIENEVNKTSEGDIQLLDKWQDGFGRLQYENNVYYIQIYPYL